MNIHVTLPGQIGHDLAVPDLDEYDRREEFLARLERDRKDETEKFSARMAADQLNDDEFYQWADNGGTEELARAFEDDNDRVFLQLVIRAHQHQDLQELTGPIIERLKRSAEEHRKGELSWLTD